MIAHAHRPRGLAAIRFTLLTAVLAAPFLSTACSSAALEEVGSLDSAAKVGDDKTDCFPQCKQEDYDALTKGGLKAACKTLKEGWAKPVESPAWPGWDDKKPICIGHKDEIKDRKDCNRLVDAPNWSPCANELMIVCSKNKEPGFGQIVLAPKKGGFPATPKDPPSVTDQELACIKQWKCPVKNPKVLPSNVGIRAEAATCDGGTCAVCDDDWVIEEPAAPPSPPPMPTTTATPTDAGSPPLPYPDYPMPYIDASATPSAF